jgi:hypothetical protein
MPCAGTSQVKKAEKGDGKIQAEAVSLLGVKAYQSMLL